MNWIRPGKLAQLGVLGMNRRNVGYIGRYNDRANYPLVDNKLKTKLMAQKMGLVVPKLLHTIRTQHEIEGIEAVLADFPTFVIKPAQGSGGKGILVIRGRSDRQFRKSSGDLIGINDIKRHLTNTISGLHSLGGRTDVAIIEALVETTDSDGKANLHQGAVGVGLDIGSGRAIAAVQHNRLIEAHPDTGADLRGIAVPNWQQLLTLAARCFEATRLGYLGCDIVIDRHAGPLLLELNARPGLSIQIANADGLLPRLQHIETLDSPFMTVQDRVEGAMTWFGHSNQASQQTLWEEA
jgi:hypothetical protein